MKVLAVCSGNTCRSPMAEALLRAKGFDASSAGIFPNVGAPASPNAVTVMKEIRMDISNHRAVELTPEMIQDADAVLTMTEEHRAICLSGCPDCEDKIVALGILDPFGGDVEIYRRCRDELNEKITAWAAEQC